MAVSDALRCELPNRPINKLFMLDNGVGWLFGLVFGVVVLLISVDK